VNLASTLGRIALLLALLLAAPALAADTAEAKAKKPTLAILDFPPTRGACTCSRWSRSGAMISGVLRDLFTSEISELADGALRLVEREQLKEVRGELKFQQGAEVDPASAQKLGKLLGARYVLTGKITRLACKVQSAKTGWGVDALVSKTTGSRMAGKVAGSASARNVNFSGRLDARLIEVETGEVLVTFKDEAETSDTSAKVAGTGSEVEYDDELASKIFEPLVKKMAAKVIKKTLRAAGETE
jgi:curli biogenesis system outer membrane secretion channel CsgG